MRRTSSVIGAHRGLHGQGGVAGAQRVVFVGNGRAEQGHNAVAEHLVDGALEAVHGVHHVVDSGVEELLGGFGIKAADEFRRVLEVSKQHGDLLALAFEGAAGGEDFLGEIGGRVAERRVRAGSPWGGGRGSGLREKRGPAFATELGLGLIRKPALGTRHPEGCAAFVTKLQAIGILKATARAVHGCALRHGRGAAGVRGQTFQCAPLTWVYGMRCQYSRCRQVSSEKRETAPGAGGVRRNTLAVGSVTAVVDNYSTRPEPHRSAAVPLRP